MYDRGDTMGVLLNFFELRFGMSLMEGVDGRPKINRPTVKKKILAAMKFYLY